MPWTIGLGPLLAVGRLVKDAAAYGVAEGKRRREDQAWAPLRQSVEWRIATAIGTMYVRGVANCGLPAEGVFDGWPRHLRELHSRVTLRGDYALRLQDLRNEEADGLIVLAATCVGLRFVPELHADLSRLSKLDPDSIPDAELRRRLTRTLIAGDDVRRALKPLDQSLDDREFELRAATNAGVMAAFFEAANELLYWSRREVGLPTKRKGI